MRDEEKRGEEGQGMGAGREKIGYASVGGRKKYWEGDSGEGKYGEGKGE
jgi:hypothetical protein